MKFLICLVLAGITITVFAGVARCSFIALDDWVYVVNNPNIRDGFSWSAIHWALKSVYASYWIPVTWLIHIVDCQLYGLNPAGHHLTNLAFHVANTVLLFLLLNRLTARLWPSAFVALLFGVHPMHVESVAWVAELKDVVSAFFFLLTLLAYTRYAELLQIRDAPLRRPLPREAGKKDGRLVDSKVAPLDAARTAQRAVPTIALLFYVLSLVLFTLGLMSKPMLVTLPYVLLLLDFWPLQRFNVSTLKRVFIEKVPFLLLSVFFSYVTFLAGRLAGAVKPSADFSLADRIGHVPVSFVWYIGKFVWPANLSVLYILHKGATSDLEIVLALLLLLGVTAIALFRARANPYLIVGWLWFLGMLIPVIGIVQAGDQAYADRFAYLPYIGLSIIFAWGISEMAGTARCGVTAGKPGGTIAAGRPATLVAPLDAARTPQRSVPTILFAGVAVIGVACCWRTIAEVGYWKDGPTLLNRALALDPRDEMAWGALGFEYDIRTNEAKAFECVRRAISVNSQYPPAWNYLGHLYANKKDYADAENAYQTALSLTWFNADRIYISRRLGDAFEDDQKYDQAADAYRSSLRLDASQADVQTRLGQCLLRTKQADAAAAAFQNAIALEPSNAAAYAGLGMISQGAGIDSDAIAQYRNALKADPDTVVALNNLAWILAADSDPALRNGSEAVSLAERACQLTDNQDGMYIGTLAAAYAEAGRFDAAVATAQKAHDVALTHGDNQHAARNAELMELYKSHRAYHMGDSSSR